MQAISKNVKKNNYYDGVSIAIAIFSLLGSEVSA